MTVDEMLAALRERSATIAAERAKHTDAIAAIRSAYIGESRDPSEAETTETLRLVALREAADATLDDIKARAAEIESDERSNAAARALIPAPEQAERKHSPARVVREERTYSPEKSRRGEASFFADSFRATNMGDAQSAARLARHDAEVRAEGEFTERATTTSSYAGLVVPQYLLEQAAPLARAGRPFANSVNRLQLPDQGMSIVIPRGTTGASAAIQATQNAAVSSTDQAYTDLTVPVVTIAGQQDVSRQSLERGYPGLDELVYMDLAGAYAVALDDQTINGTGAAGQMLGTRLTAGINQSTAFTAAATPATFYAKTAGAVNAVETTRFMPPNAIAMHPRRWNWLVSQLDSSGRPFVVPTADGNNAMNALGVFPDAFVNFVNGTSVGTFQGLPVINDSSIPTALGSGPEDISIVYRREDLLLWEDLSNGGLPKQLRFEQTLGGSLTVKLVAYNYAAFTAGRYPQSVALVGGNSAAGFGLVAPTF